MGRRPKRWCALPGWKWQLLGDCTGGRQGSERFQRHDRQAIAISNSTWIYSYRSQAVQWLWINSSVRMTVLISNVVRASNRELQASAESMHPAGSFVLDPFERRLPSLLGFSVVLGRTLKLES